MELLGFLQLLLCLVYCLTSHGVDCKGCEQIDYSLMKKILLTEVYGNIANLESAFFPTDRPISQVVDVTYFIGKNLSMVQEEKLKPEVDKTSTPTYAYHRILRDVDLEIEETLQDQVIKLKFRWAASSIPLLIGPHLLEALSLYAFETNVAPLNLSVEVTPDCYDTIESLDSYDRCTEKSHIINIFSGLTSNLLLYAKHPNSQEHSEVFDEMGYSVLLYSTNTSSEYGYCVPPSLKKNYHKLRVTLVISFCFLAFFLSIGTPAAIVGTFNQLTTKMKKPNSNWLYFVWATVIVVIVATLLIASVNVIFIVKYYSVLKIYSTAMFSTYMGLLLAAFIFNVLTISAGLLCICKDPKNSVKVESLPVPKVFCVCCLCSQQQNDADGQVHPIEESVNVGCCAEKSVAGRTARIILLGISCYFFTVFLVLVSFHIVFIILGASANPVVALSHTAFYITAFLCLIMFMAFFLKFTNMSKCDKLCTWPITCSKELCINHAQYTLAIMCIFFLIPCVIGFGLFYYFFSIMVQDYRYNGDILSTLGTFLPSALLAFATLAANKMINCISKEQDDKKSEETV